MSCSSAADDAALSVPPRAADELREAHNWYNAQRAGLTTVAIRRSGSHVLPGNAVYARRAIPNDFECLADALM